MASRPDETYEDGPDMRNEANKRRTFKGWESSTQPTTLAKEGFFYLGRGDRVKCHCCRGELGCWRSTDDVGERHIRNYPHCRFANSGCSDIPGRNIAVHTLTQTQERSPIPRHILSNKIRKVEYHKNDSIFGAGIFYQWNHHCKGCFYCRGRLVTWEYDLDAWQELATLFPGFPPMTPTSSQTGEIESDAAPIVYSTTSDAEQGPSTYVFIPNNAAEGHRLASFAKLGRPFDTEIRRAAEQGFYFTGMVNIARCFSCGKEWQITELEYSSNLHASDCQMKDQPGAAGNSHLAKPVCLRRLLHDLIGMTQQRPVATSGVQTALPGPDEPKHLPTSSYPSRHHPQSP